VIATFAGTVFMMASMMEELPQATARDADVFLGPH